MRNNAGVEETGRHPELRTGDVWGTSREVAEVRALGSHEGLLSRWLTNTCPSPNTMKVGGATRCLYPGVVSASTNPPPNRSEVINCWMLYEVNQDSERHSSLPETHSKAETSAFELGIGVNS